MSRGGEKSTTPSPSTPASSSFMSSSSLHILHEVDSVDTAYLDEIEKYIQSIYSTSTSSAFLLAGPDNNNSKEEKHERIRKDSFDVALNTKKELVGDVYNSLSSVKESCDGFIRNVDQVLGVLDNVSSSHKAVTERTNVLMMNCEALLEYQQNLHNVAERLNGILKPFNEVEEIAHVLGIPVDASGKKTMRAPDTFVHNIDPRSSEFKDALQKISTAIACLQENIEIKDSSTYLNWLKSIQKRAKSLIVKAMLELLEGAYRTCADEQAKRDLKKSATSIIEIDDIPIESMSVYSKFRGLGFRMRELCEMLRNCDACERSLQNSRVSSPTHRKGSDSHDSLYKSNPISHHENLLANSSEPEVSAVAEVLHKYRSIRCELLQPVVSAAARNVIVTSGKSLVESGNIAKGYKNDIRNRISTGAITNVESPASVNDVDTTVNFSLCSAIRQTYGILLSVAHLEQQLYHTLFRKSASMRDVTEAVSGHRSVENESVDEMKELVTIIQAMTSEASGQLRSLIIRENDVHSLCRVIHTLTEDVQSQLAATAIYGSLFYSIEENLLVTASDARERLLYCVENQLRFKVQLFEPLPSHIAYPEILEKSKEQVASEGDNNAHLSPTNVTSTWYPTLRESLSLLSQLYGAVNKTVFEDLARRTVILCIQTLTSGANKIRKTKAPIHADLFLVRHLLILREQLVPFDIKLQSIEKELDFTPTSSALNTYFFNSRSMLRLDSSNALLKIAQEGIPAVHDAHIDVKRKMDENLKAACVSFKNSALDYLAAQLISFIAKISAFVGGGEIPVYRGNTVENAVEVDPVNTVEACDVSSYNGQIAILPADMKKALTGQAFMKPDRLKAVLTSVADNLIIAQPNLNSMIKLYVPNSSTRSIIVKPILHELMIAKRKMGTIVASCVESNVERKELEALLNSLQFSIT